MVHWGSGGEGSVPAMTTGSVPAVTRWASAPRCRLHPGPPVLGAGPRGCTPGDSVGPARRQGLLIDADRSTTPLAEGPDHRSSTIHAAGGPGGRSSRPSIMVKRRAEASPQGRFNESGRPVRNRPGTLGTVQLMPDSDANEVTPLNDRCGRWRCGTPPVPSTARSWRGSDRGGERLGRQPVAAHCRSSPPSPSTGLRTPGWATSGAATKRSPDSTFRRPSPGFATLRDGARSGPSRGNVSRRRADTKRKNRARGNPRTQP
jgi:hypothetical protein